MNNRSLRTAALVALALFATPAGHAQGLDGMLHKAKANVRQATDNPRQTAVPAASPATGGGGTVSDEPRVYTVATQEAYIRAVQTDPAPPSPGDSPHKNSYWWRRLHYEFKVPVQFTWDQKFLEACNQHPFVAWDFIENISTELAHDLNPAGTRVRNLRGLVTKVKAIHLTTTTQEPKSGAPGAEEGYVLSWNPATGVLTAAWATSRTLSLIAGDSHPFYEYLTANVK